MRASYRRKVIINRDALHRKIMFPHQTDLGIHNAGISWVTVLHCVAIGMIYVYLFIVSSTQYVFSNWKLTEQSGTLCPNRLQNKLPAITGDVSFCRARMAS